MAETPEKLEIKHGAFYKTRSGDVIGPAVLHRAARSVGDNHPWQIGSWSYNYNGEVYRTIGRTDDTRDSRDIVEEAALFETLSEVRHPENIDVQDTQWRYDAALAVFLVLMKELTLADSSKATVARIAVEHADELIKALREKKSWTPPNVSDV